MGRTLFWYVFKDLLRVFVMASGALAGIMSFGGLLRPLTQQGLEMGQVGRMLAYFTPAMTAYSLPVAALFSATVVYGRLSADNELTACRAGGVSLGPFFGMAFPGLLFGLLVAIISLLFLCFIVPTYTLKVEKVIYSNLAKLIANRIERTHEIRFASANIFAQRAYLPPYDPKNPTRQQVVLEGVSIVQYEKPPGAIAAKKPGKPGEEVGALEETSSINRSAQGKVPKEFLLASSATIDITERDDDQVSLVIGLEGGTKFPREFRGGMQAGIGTTQFGPTEMPSPIKEDTKFMNVGRLQDLYKNPEQSRKVATVIADFVRRDQTRMYIESLARQLNAGEDLKAGVAPRFVQFKGGGSKITLSLDPTAPAVVLDPSGDELIVEGTKPGTVTYERTDDGERSLQAARELRIKVHPDTPRKLMNVTVELMGRSPGGGTSRPVSGNYSSVIEVPMPPEILALKDRKVATYLGSTQVARGDKDRLRRELIVLVNNILAESNGRASFAVSCLILVLVGSALGMMFRSGNFLTAFAISFVPALVCITLIVAGQQTCHAVPFKIDSQPNPLKLGLTLIWSGNVINFAIATVLLWRLQRQ